jgi:REP element-mobilizing transposase RayT
MPTRGRANITEERLFFVTTTVVRFLNVFKDAAACDILIGNLKYYREKYRFNILAYAIMPSHFHWIVALDSHTGTISDIMRDIKRASSKEITEYLESNELFQHVFEKEARIYRDQGRKFWMRRFDDEAIRNPNMFWQKVKYIHHNPVEAGLVSKPEDYKYSSARNYICDDHSVITVDVKYGGVVIE